MAELGLELHLIPVAMLKSPNPRGLNLDEDCGLHKSPFLIVGGSAAHFLAALPLVSNPSIGLSQQQPVLQSRICSEKPGSTTS